MAKNAVRNPPRHSGAPSGHGTGPGIQHTGALHLRSAPIREHLDRPDSGADTGRGHRHALGAALAGGRPRRGRLAAPEDDRRGGLGNRLRGPGRLPGAGHRRLQHAARQHALRSRAHHRAVLRRAALRHAVTQPHARRAVDGAGSRARQDPERAGRQAAPHVPERGPGHRRVRRGGEGDRVDRAGAGDGCANLGAEGTTS